MYVSGHLTQHILINSQMCCAYDYLTDLNKCVLAQFANVYGTHSEASVRKCRGKLFQDDGIYLICTVFSSTTEGL